METVREKWYFEQSNASVVIEENKISTYSRVRNVGCSSFRVYRDGYLGVHFHDGKISDEEGFAIAEKNLAKKRPYPYEPQKNTGSRDLTETLPTERELIDTTNRKILRYLMMSPTKNRGIMLFGTERASSGKSRGLWSWSAAW